MIMIRPTIESQFVRQLPQIYATASASIPFHISRGLIKVWGQVSTYIYIYDPPNNIPHKQRLLGRTTPIMARDAYSWQMWIFWAA